VKLSDLAAQLLMIDLPGSELGPDELAHLDRYRWGGVLLFARNIVSRPQLAGLMQQIKEHGDPLVSVDQEGGLVDRVRFDDTVLTPGLMALAATGDPQCTELAHTIMGQQLADLGFHMDFAPCVDINSNPDNPIIGVRSFGEDPALVAEHAAAACRGLRKGGLAATAKHFPGHGDCHLDSHLALPTLPLTLEQLKDRELVPFQACIEAGVESMMTAHITFPALDPRPGRAATLSEPILNGLLRQQMGFDGVVFSDSMEMQAIADHYGVAEASILALEAGADMIITCGGFEAHLKAVEGLVEAVESGRLSRQRLEQSWQRLQQMRTRQADTSGVKRVEDLQHQMEEICRRSITLVRNQGILPLSQGPVLLLSPDLLPVTPLGEMTRSDARLSHLKLEGVEVREAHYPAETRGPALEHILEQARLAHTVIFTVYARHRLPDATRELGQRLLEANPRLVLVSLSSPYVLRDLADAPAFICSYNYTPLSLKALGEALSGKFSPQGRLTVSIPGLYPKSHRLSYPAPLSPA
jgi:beta-N-acetylhexosaminidase